jgi:hypothetical protein
MARSTATHAEIGAQHPLSEERIWHKVVVNGDEPKSTERVIIVKGRKPTWDATTLIDSTRPTPRSAATDDTVNNETHFQS